MVPPVPTSQKAAWQWAETTKPEEVTLNHVLTAYKMNLNFCNSCRRNVKGNPCCLSGLGEKPWLSDVPPVNGSDLLREQDSYVGLKNLGATCYANAFLQVWFHMPEIRNAVFSWDTDSLDIGDDVYSPICEIISCLQEVFGLLYFSKRKYIDPTILLNCLLLDNTVQQDAQEFSKLFMSKLEELPSHGRSIFHDFVGRYDYVTSCTQCGNQTRSRSEFYELDLNIVNNKKLSSCLDEFLEQEMLDGDNQFFCSSCKMKQNATRCIELVDLPSTLNLQLLRFVYDKEKHSKKKISSPLTFPDTLDMSPYVKRNSNSSPMSEESHIYDLFAILIHSGQLANSGHYIAVIRDCKTASTFQFNDEKVVKLEGDLSGYDLDNAIEEDCLTSDNNGNSSLNNKTKKCKSSKEMSLVNAYMLVYRKRNATVNVCEDLQFEELPNNLKEKIRIHNKELDKDLLRESHKREMLCQKEENIKLLYSTINSYEGCSAEEKLEKFEFVPVQNLTKFFEDNEMEIGDGNVLSDAKKKEADEAETNVDDDDDPGLDVNITTHQRDDKEIGKLFFCKHKKLNPDKVMNLKLLPTDVVDVIANQLGLCVRLPCSEVLCRECVVERCTIINSKMALSEDTKKIASLMKSKNYQPTGFLVGKESWKNWRKLVEKDTKDGIEEQEQIDMKSEMFNSDLLCIHDGLDPNQQNWKPVSSDVWKILRKYFPTCPEYSCGVPCCSICEDKSQQEQIVQDESKQQALQLKQYLSDLFLNKRRPSLSTLRKHQAHLNKQIQNEALISMECKSSFQTPSATSRDVVVINISDDDSKPDTTWMQHAEPETVKDRSSVKEVDRPHNDQLKYFLVSSTFIERWKKCCKDSSKHEMPVSVCNCLLVCCHGKLLFDPWDSEQSNEIGRQFVLLWPNEWQVLKNYFHVDHEVYVEIAEMKSSGSHFAISVPELCIDCLEERRKEEIQSRFQYAKAKIYVHRLDSFDSDSSAIQQCVLSVNNNDNNYCNNAGSEEKSKKRKSDDDVPGEKYPRLECCAAVRRSGRRSKNRGEKEILVSSNTTLKELHIEIFRQFQVYKTNQVLYFDGRELIGDDCTLGELCVPPEALIKLEVLEDMEENLAPHMIGGGSVIEEGFKGTGLVG